MNRDFTSVGIKLPLNTTGGRIRMTCPFCSSERRNKTQRCLSVDVSNGLYHCFHCGESGYVPTDDEVERRREQAARREEKLKVRPSRGQYHRPKAFPSDFLIRNCIDQPSAQPLIEYLTVTRKLSLDVMQQLKVTLAYGSFARQTADKDAPAEYEQIRCVAFNFFDRGEYVNVKYRTLDKRFTFMPKGELIPWNIDAIIHKPVCYVTEGEFDAMTLIQCGYLETISVPNGAQKNLSFLDRFVETHFEDKIRIILALDNDERGVMLRNELIRRLDPERCQLVEWKEGCKDANDVLVRYGEDAVRECVENAHDIPLTGIQTAEDVHDELEQLFLNGVQRGAATCIGGFDDLMTFETGRYMVVSGRPGDGKSEFIDELCLRLCLLHDWKVAYFSPENVPIIYHLRKLCEKLTRYPFQPSRGMTRELFDGCVKWLTDNVCHILPGFGEDGIIGSDDALTGSRPAMTSDGSQENVHDSFSLDNILQIAHRAVARRGVRVLVIDPLNRIDQDMQDGKSELQWYSHVNNTLSRWARRHKCLVILVAHPRKVNRANLDGKRRRVEMNDINGSADFGNKADYCLIIDRDDDLKVVTVCSDKVKFKHLGTRGECFMHYDTVSSRYLHCSLQKLGPMDVAPSGTNVTVVQNKNGTRFAKTIDWTHFNTSWIDSNGRPILREFLERFRQASNNGGQLPLFT